MAALLCGVAMVIGGARAAKQPTKPRYIFHVVCTAFRISCIKPPNCHSAACCSCRHRRAPAWFHPRLYCLPVAWCSHSRMYPPCLLRGGSLSRMYPPCLLRGGSHTALPVARWFSLASVPALPVACWRLYRPACCEMVLARCCCTALPVAWWFSLASVPPCLFARWFSPAAAVPPHQSAPS